MDKIDRKRERMDIVHDILDLINSHNNKIKPTPLLRYSNLSTKSFNEYFNELIKKNLIEEYFDKKNRRYIKLTEKGFGFLEKYKFIKGFIDEFNL